MSTNFVPDIPALGEHLVALGEQLVTNGEILWQRSREWVNYALPSSDERGGGLGSAVKDHDEDMRAAKYHDEVVALLRRLDADERRLTSLLRIVCPARPKELTNKDLLAAQVAAEGWCVSCHRDNGHLEPVYLGRYKDACRFCGEWRAANAQQVPPLHVVRWRHRHPGKRIPLSVVEARTVTTGA